ncbi:MAG: hypothetical protein ACRD38_01315 [Nitrososphaerales archaeon]
MSETIQEVTLILQHEGQEIERIGKTFGMVGNGEEENQEPAKTIDDTISEILNEIQQVANNVGLEISKEELTQITMLLIISIVRPTGLQEIIVNLQKPKTEPEAKENGDTKETDA